MVDVKSDMILSEACTVVIPGNHPPLIVYFMTALVDSNELLHASCPCQGMPHVKIISKIWPTSYPFESTGLHDAICHYCLSTARHRMLYSGPAPKDLLEQRYITLKWN